MIGGGSFGATGRGVSGEILKGGGGGIAVGGWAGG
jgi:hypothetical protein